MTWGTITDEGIAEAEALVGVPLRRERMRWIETATRDAIRHFAWGVGDSNPLWLDKEYAQRSPFGTIVAPPCVLYAVDGTVVAPKLPGVQWIYAGTAWTWFEPILLDDTFTVEARLVKQEIKSGRRFPKWVLQTGEIRFTNQHGRLVAIAVGRCARTPRGENRETRSTGEDRRPPGPHKYTAAELEDIENQVLAEPRRGDQPLYWEDVKVGEQIPQVVRGPLSVIDIMAWYAAQQGATHYGGVHGDALRYRRRHADYHLNKETGANESAGRGHLETTTGQDVGMGGAYDIGPQRIAWAQHMLTNWIGDHGFLHSLDVAVRQPNLVGDTLWWRGEVNNEAERQGYSVVDLAIRATNQNNVVSADGTASVILPSRAKGAVRFPIPGSLAGA
jgi:acyl dehydratase